MVTLCTRQILERSILVTGGNRGPNHPPPQDRFPGSFSLIGRKWMLVEIVILQSTDISMKVHILSCLVREIM